MPERPAAGAVQVTVNDVPVVPFAAGLVMTGAASLAESTRTVPACASVVRPAWLAAWTTICQVPSSGTVTVAVVAFAVAGVLTVLVPLVAMTV
jgi:hypothetical protein